MDWIDVVLAVSLLSVTSGIVSLVAGVFIGYRIGYYDGKGEPK